jgi:hypothetical protein
MSEKQNEITVVAHACKAWPKNFVMYIADCGRPIAMGHDAFSATAKRLAEEGLAKDFQKLVVNFVDGRPSVAGLIKEGLK